MVITEVMRKTVLTHSRKFDLLKYVYLVYCVALSSPLFLSVCLSLSLSVSREAFCITDIENSNIIDEVTQNLKDLARKFTATIDIKGNVISVSILILISRYYCMTGFILLYSYCSSRTCLQRAGR